MGLAQADAAIVGIVETVGPPDDENRTRTVTFRVERALKGAPGATVRVVTAAYGASCGLEVTAGQRVGLFLERSGNRWESGLCAQIEAEELERAARPYPLPPPRARARLLAGGRFGDAGLVALDEDGRLAGYAFNTEGDVLSVCPGGRFAVQAGDALHVVRLRDLRPVRRVPLPGDATAAVRCLASDGSDAVALSLSFGSASERQTLVRVTRGRRSVLRRAVVEGGALGSRRAVLVEGRRSRALVSVEYQRGAARRVLRLGEAAPQLALSPDGTRAALLHQRTRPTLRVVTLATRRVVARRFVAEPAEPLLWLSPQRLAAGRQLFGPSLAPAGRLPRVPGAATAVSGDVLWTLPSRPAGFLRVLSLPDGPVRTLRGFDLAGAHSLAALPGVVAIRGATQRAPSPTVPAGRAASAATGKSASCPVRG